VVCIYRRCENCGVAMLVSRAGDKAHPVCAAHARRLERISRDVVVWLGVGG
jgi:hypothetical protein